MRRGVRALIASHEAKVPKVEFNVRKSYGVAADAPNSLGEPDGLNLRFGWPAGEWGGIPIEGGVAAAYRREIESAPDPEVSRRSHPRSAGQRTACSRDGIPAIEHRGWMNYFRTTH